MKKHVVLVIILILLFVIFIYFYLRTVSYELSYTVDELKIIEKYNKNLGAYYFAVNYNDKIYELISFDQYTNKRKLIENVNISQSDNETCLSFDTKEIKLYSICSDNDSYYVANLTNQAEFNKVDSYENINIGNLDNKTYLLWNYHDFIYLNNGTKEKLTLFSKDIYNLSLIYTFDEYLLVPDYEQSYLFDKIYVINTKQARIKEINLRFDVYFNSYFLGHDKNKVYIYDLRENQEFYIDLKKEEIYTTESQVLINNKWKSVSNQAFQNERPTFSEEEALEVFLENNSLYMKIPNGNTKLLLTKREVSELVKVDGLNIYYISGETMYKYNLFKGEEAILQYSEWNFNYQNMVFIF